MTATASVVIGTWAGFVLARFGRFKGFTLYTGMINAPLVIPEAIQGISLLLFVVFSRVRLGLNPEMNALATLFIMAVTIGVIFVNRWMQARATRRRVNSTECRPFRRARS